MIVAIVIGCYALAWLYTARRVFYAFRDDEYPPDPGMEMGAIGALSLIIGALWPLALPVALVMWHPRKTPAELREEAETARWERDKLKARIAELEREAGIRPG